MQKEIPECRLPKAILRPHSSAREAELVHVFKSFFPLSSMGTEIVYARQYSAMLLDPKIDPDNSFYFGDKVSLGCPNWL